MSSKTEHFGVWAVAIAISFTGCQAPPPASHELSDDDLAAVRAVWDAIEMADLAADWETSQSLMTSDFVHLDPRTEPIRGVAAWREWVESMEFGVAEGGYTVDEVGGSGDLAYVMWNFDTKWTEAGESFEGQGKGMTLFRRETGGSWLMSRNAWNNNPE